MQRDTAKCGLVTAEMTRTRISRISTITVAGSVIFVQLNFMILQVTRGQWSSEHGGNLICASSKKPKFGLHGSYAQEA